MKKNELMNGDIAMMRNGLVALYLATEGREAFVYKESGFDFAEDAYNDDLTHRYDGPEWDVMRVYRADDGMVIGFGDFDENGYTVWERDESWVDPNEEAREEKRRTEMEAFVAELDAAHERMKGTFINIIAQAFYGNRTGTEIRPENMGRFILGYLDNDIDVSKPIDVTAVRIPGSEKLVLVYNKYEEEEARQRNAEHAQNGERVTKPLAVIPEENVELYSRCIACRMNEEGKFESLEREDYGVLERYLAE